MKKIVLVLIMAVFIVSCATVKVSDESIKTKADGLDFGDSTSETIVDKAWKSWEKKNYLETLAYTQKCAELYGEEGKKMNDALTSFASPDTAFDYWALNDVGTCLYIMANAYVEVKMYPEATAAYESLASDYNYAQCWDPKGWFWQPAASAELNAKKYRNW